MYQIGTYKNSFLKSKNFWNKRRGSNDQIDQIDLLGEFMIVFLIWNSKILTFERKMPHGGFPPPLFS